MDFELFYNHFSAPLPTRDSAYSQLTAAIRDALFLNKTGDDRITLSYDLSNINMHTLADNYYYSDYIDDLRNNGENDLMLTLLEMVDKAPLLNNLSDEDVDFLASSMIYVSGISYDRSMDLFGIAFVKNGIVLSLPSNPAWVEPSIAFSIFSAEQTAAINYLLRNISQPGHSVTILNGLAPQISLAEQFPTIRFENDIIAWFITLPHDDKVKISNAIQHCLCASFEIGRPLVDTIHGSRIANLKELRAGNHSQDSGKLRILFLRDENRNVHFLTGFVKYSNDYSIPISRAEAIYNP